MRVLSPINWRLSRPADRAYMTLARTLLGVLRSTFREGVTTGAMTRMYGSTEITVAFFSGLPVVTIKSMGEDEQVATQRQQPELYFALFEMLQGTTDPGLGSNSNSLVLKTSIPPRWFRDEDDAAVYPSVGKYPLFVPDEHALHQYADRRKGVTVSCGFGRIPYLAIPERSVGVAVNGKLITTDLVSIAGFDEDYCLSPHILSVVDNIVTFAFICAPPYTWLRMSIVAHNIILGTTSIITTHGISSPPLMVWHPAFGFYYSPNGDKCCGVVIAQDGDNWLLKDIEFVIDIEDESVSSIVTDPAFSYTSVADYEIVIGSYYDETGTKTPVTMKPSSSTDSTVSDAGFSYAGTVTSGGSYSPPRGVWDISYSSITSVIDDVCFYRGSDKWVTLYKYVDEQLLQYSYANKFRMYFNEGGDLLYYGVDDSVDLGYIGTKQSSAFTTRLARLCTCNLETGSFIHVETDYRSIITTPVIWPNEYDMDSWVTNSVVESAPDVWSVSVSGLSSAAPWAPYDPSATTSTETLLRQKAVTRGGNLTIEADESDIPAHAISYLSSDYSFALNSYFARSAEYKPRRLIPPSYTTSEEANTPNKFADFFINLLEYWGYNDRCIGYGEDQTTGLPRYMTTEQYENHLIGMGALYELVEDRKPISFAAFNTYAGIKVLFNGMNGSASLPPGGSSTFMPAGVI